MGRVLKSIQNKLILTGELIIIILVLTGSNIQERPYAYGPVTGSFTAYAMGAEYSSLGAINPGVFANHSRVYCPNYSPSNWPGGTKITLSEIVYIPSRYNEYPYTYSSFYKRDIGDFECNEGEYWADLYFGRYKHSEDNCSCSGVINSVCLDGYTNSCNNAINWGRNTYSYQFFFP